MLLVQSIKSRKSLINPLNLLVLLMLSSCSTVASVYYASPGGEDCISCGLSESSPFLSLNYAVKFLNPGDTLYLMSGEYRESKHISNIPSGTRHKPIVIMAYRDQIPIIMAPSDTRYHFTFYFQGILANGQWERQAHIELNGLVLDGARTQSEVPNFGLIKISEAITDTTENRYADSIAIKSCTLRNASRVGILIRGGTGHKLVKSKIHEIKYFINSGRSKENPTNITGIYLASSGNTVANCDISNITSNGVLVFNSDKSKPPFDNSILDCNIWNCQRGIQVALGEEHTIKGNIIRQTDIGVYVSQKGNRIVVLENTFYQNHLGVLLNSKGTTGHKILGNIFYGNGPEDNSIGVMVKEVGVNINNNLFYNDLTGIHLNGKFTEYPGNTFDRNPHFQDPDNLDFRLKESGLSIGPERNRFQEIKNRQ